MLPLQTGQTIVLSKKLDMSKRSGAYILEFREQMVGLVQAVSKPSGLAEEFGCYGTSNNAWVRQAKTDEVGGGGPDTQSTAVERQDTQERYISMGTVDDAHDNASPQSFFATLKCGLIDKRTWGGKARLTIFTRIESWCNPLRS